VTYAKILWLLIGYNETYSFEANTVLKTITKYFETLLQYSFDIDNILVTYFRFIVNSRTTPNQGENWLVHYDVVFF